MRQLKIGEAAHAVVYNSGPHKDTFVTMYMSNAPKFWSSWDAAHKWFKRHPGDPLDVRIVNVKLAELAVVEK